MNGRVFAVSRPAWGVDAPPLFPDVPAAAAISPDPCARCAWHGPMDGTNYPYFGPLYNNSLPPTAYRLQSGCMPNLGHFWPPTPPPDGCGRFDGSNLYYGPPVLRPPEAVSNNIRSQFQGIGHFSHVVDSPKESNQRIFKRETPISPNISTSNISCSSVSKSESFKNCSIDSKLKSPSSFAYSLPKQELHTVSSHEPYLCVPETRSNSSLHPSTDKSCFSPSYNSKNTLYLRNSPQETSNKARPLPGHSVENASPLKNVYFSSFESEHVNTAQSNKLFDSEVASPFEQKTSSKSRQALLSQGNQSGSHSYRKCDYQGVQEHPVSAMRNDKHDGVVIIKEHFKQRSHSSKVKSEKVSQSDCKYQKSSSKSSSAGPDYKNSVLNNPTSVTQTKVEPNDRFFTPNCSSAYLRYGTSHVTSSSFLRSTDFQDNFQVGLYPCPDRTWPYSDVPSMSSPKNYFKPPSEQTFFLVPPHEGLISVAQTAPLDMDVPRSTGTMQQSSVPASSLREDEKNSDDEVQIIGVQTKHSLYKSGSKHFSKESYNHCSGLNDTLPTVKQFKKEVDKEKIHLASCSENTVAEKSPELVSCNSVLLTTKSYTTSTEQLNSRSELAIPKLEADVIEIKEPLIKREDIDDERSIKCCINVPVIEYERAKPSFGSITESSTSSACNKTEPNIGKEFNENHGLNLLLNTIERVASMERSQFEESAVLPKIEDQNLDNRSSSNSSKIRGLDLLSVIAGERLVLEFEVKSEPEECKVESNYPDIKDDKCANDTVKQVPNTPTITQESSVFKMQDRLAELQKKYKQKQKELLRLKPKKRLANSFLKEKPKKLSSMEQASSNVNSELKQDICLSLSSHEQDVQILEDAPSPKFGTTENTDSKNIYKESRVSETNDSFQRKTRHGFRQSKHETKRFPDAKKSKVFKKVVKIRTRRLRNLPAISESNSLNRSTDTEKKDLKEVIVLPKKSKVYSLRHSSLNAIQNSDCYATEITSNSSISKKRKSDNPKKFIPSKQTKLSETIVAKHLRNRILFDTSGTTSEDDNIKDGVPEYLYDAFLKCHLSEEQKICGLNLSNTSAIESILSNPTPSTLRKENLTEGQRLLALEDNLFYAGYIKECLKSNRYGISLDGQRGNRLHNFTREELLTQTILESKPVSSDLPEGTRVCAFWSQQYRCLYPGFVGKASSPSADWSEPRIFVLFDDGDSGQIPIKNVRLIPTEIIPAEYESRLHSQQIGTRSSKAKLGRQASRRLRRSTQKMCNVSFRDNSNENDSKESSCVSVNESSCDDSCFNEYSDSKLSSVESSPNVENSTVSCSTSSLAEDDSKPQKKEKKRSKRRSGQHLGGAVSSSDAKVKRRKKYKERHHRHHHHRHRHHHHHHHHHHHSKKHKHKRKGVCKSSTPVEVKKYVLCENDLSSQNDPPPTKDNADHSKSINLPQNGHVQF